MASKIFETLLNRKIGNFVNSFVEDSSSIFYKDGSLFHPGEFGLYRERTLIELLKIVIPSRYDISDGFVITSDDQVSTQCDIVMYDSSEIPFLTDSSVRFYPVESVISIGEVKSDLKYETFKEALVKLAKNKRLRNDFTAPKKTPPGYFEEVNYLFSFLLCKKLPKSLVENAFNFDDIYGDVEPQWRHNLILSIEDGLFDYSFAVKDFPVSMKTRWESLGANVNTTVFHPYPIRKEVDEIFICSPRFTIIDTANPLKHIKEFVVSLTNGIGRAAVYVPDMLPYTELPAAKLR